MVKVWIGGQVVNGEDATVSVLDHGVLYGDGVFEGIRVYQGRVFRLDDHLRRLAHSAAYLGLTLPYDIEQIRQIVLDTVCAHGEADAYVRLLVTRGIGELGVDPATCRASQLICIVAAIALFNPEHLQQGLHMVTVTVRKPSADVLNPEVKSLNYLNSVMAKQEATARGADEALLLNARGTVAEAAVANVFVVIADTLVTPPTTDGALPGITRASVLDIADQLGINTQVRSIGHAELMRADEVFITGTGARIVSVSRLDSVPIGCGKYPVTHRINRHFATYVEEHSVAALSCAA